MLHRGAALTVVPCGVGTGSFVLTAAFCALGTEEMRKSDGCGGGVPSGATVVSAGACIIRLVGVEDLKEEVEE